eukprot:CAMPEP_0119264842 /NCGR_PEP_ID=MMETSP1329-20130426/3827_1 /TAXON_ID=114041 /ORGANISM="Genus nov. species nov., Strain RCC1024" /LENGTH=572 /DNA_ID=CAMNT_0007264635 /DNA_START=233 /DNA_END=1948 /DNA_ORIENTATION=-
MAGRPLRLIRCGDDSDNYAFTLEEDHLDEVLNKIPAGMPVAVVSVVGAFRTGKSFLLTLILRYLRHRARHPDDASDAWLAAEGASIAEGNANEKASDGCSFEWRGGRVRVTTGITVWSEPFLLGGLAVVVLDTQGLFDNETPMGLTSCIFGLSTLMSSYQIYNVANRIQEDNLQQLALFTEYGRMALEAQRAAKSAADLARTDFVARKREEARLEAERRRREARKCDGSDKRVEAPADVVAPPAAADAFDEPPPPFQRLEFLVRDWTEFDDDMSDADMEAQMKVYLEEVMNERKADDLQFTREQITQCFTSLGCRLLPHPGFAVTKKTYDGAVAKIEPLFKRCADAFVRHVFGEALEAKTLNGRVLRASELGNYVRAYAGMFRDGAKFPQAQTMLEATAEANNRNARAKALESYCAAMDARVGAGPDVRYLEAKELRQACRAARDDALLAFDTMATMGRKSAIDEFRASLDAEIGRAQERFRLMNEARNPFKNAEFYVIPLMIASASFVVKRVTDALCPEDGSLLAATCNRAEDALATLYGGIVFVMLLVAYQRVRGLKKYMKLVLAPLLAS